jgi:hypothetical protein
MFLIFIINIWMLHTYFRNSFNKFICDLIIHQLSIFIFIGIRFTVILFFHVFFFVVKNRLSNFSQFYTLILLTIFGLMFINQFTFFSFLKSVSICLVFLNFETLTPLFSNRSFPACLFSMR